MADFPDPTQPRSSRAEVLLAYLEFFRERSIEKVEGLGADDAARSRVPSGWSPIELLHHLRWVERRWLEWGFSGIAIGDPWGDQTEGRWRVHAGLAPPEVIEALRDQGRRTREIVGAHRLDEPGAPGPRWRGTDPATLERILLHLLQEWARHLGQLDVAVELAGGQVGK